MGLYIGNDMAMQFITPNPAIPCQPGWCLEYVRETFGIGPKYPTAIDGWNASGYKHLDQNIPDGVWVPLWFSLSDNPAGHVVLRQPDGSIWSASSPTATTPVHHTSITDLMSYYGGRLTYLGWTEDVEGVPVVSLSGAGVLPGPADIAVVANTWAVVGKQKVPMIAGGVIVNTFDSNPGASATVSNGVNGGDIVTSALGGQGGITD